MTREDRYANRRARVAERLEAAGPKGEPVGSLLVTDLRNISYLTGFRGSAGVLLLDAGGRGVLSTDSRYDVQVREQAPGVDHVITRDYFAGALGAAESSGTGAALADQSASVGVEAHDVTLARATALHKALEEAGRTGGVVETTSLVEEVRRVKDDVELAAIARACDVVDIAWEAALAGGWIRAGRTERAIAADLEHAMRVAGSDGTSFDTIVASGPNGALPHHRTSDRMLAQGDLVVIDFGALVDGYASDCTRTVAIGSLPDELRKIYDIVLAAQREAVDAVAPGVGCAALDSIAREHITRAGYGENFGHSLGHGVGLDVHEGPAVSARSDSTLVVGDVVTVEPGIYLPGLGGVRIEDTVAVTGSGHQVLTTTSKDLVEL